MEIQSTMYQILDTLVPWWHLAQVTSKGESHLLGVHSGSWNNFGRVHTYPLQQKLSCLILLVSPYYSMAVNRGWSPRIWKTKINAFATSCYRVMLNIKRIDHVLNTTVYSMTNTVPLIHLVRHRQLKFLGHILQMSKEEPARRYALYIPTIGKRRPGRPRTSYLNYYKDCLGIMKEQCKNSRLPHLLMIVVHGETLWLPAPQPMDDDDDSSIETRHFNKAIQSVSKIQSAILKTITLVYQIFVVYFP